MFLVRNCRRTNLVCRKFESVCLWSRTFGREEVLIHLIGRKSTMEFLTLVPC